MENHFYSGKKVLVAGGSGLVGMTLVGFLLQKGAKVRVVALDDGRKLPKEVEFLRLDLLNWEACLEACKGMEYAFNIACIKGSVGMGESQAATFLDGNALVNLHLLKAARESGVKRYLYSSSIAVYPDAQIFRENEVWDRPPHPHNNKFAAWGKRIGELQCEAYRDQYGYKMAIVRPANIYGPHDNFDPATAMVIPALISRICRGEDPLVVWGDGGQVRDFLYVKDCARGMLLAMERHCECDPLNLGSGIPVSIREVVETILRYVPHAPRVEWDSRKPIGNRIRLMDMTKTKEKLGFTPEVSLDQGIKETVEWYLTQKDRLVKKDRVLA